MYIEQIFALGSMLQSSGCLPKENMVSPGGPIWCPHVTGG